MSKKYEQEQGENNKRMKILRAELKKEIGQLYTAEGFLDVVHQYTNATGLTQRMLTEIIDHIDVYHAEKVGGVKTQEVKIFYNCIGAFVVPEWESIPELMVYIKTRKGVALSYASGQRAG